MSPEEVKVMKLLKSAFDALSAAVAVVVLMGFVVYESMGHADSGTALAAARSRIGEPTP